MEIGFQGKYFLWARGSFLLGASGEKGEADVSALSWWAPGAAPHVGSRIGEVGCWASSRAGHTAETRHFWAKPKAGCNPRRALASPCIGSHAGWCSRGAGCPPGPGPGPRPPSAGARVGPISLPSHTKKPLSMQTGIGGGAWMGHLGPPLSAKQMPPPHCQHLDGQGLSLPCLAASTRARRRGQATACSYYPGLGLCSGAAQASALFTTPLLAALVFNDNTRWQSLSEVCVRSLPFFPSFNG